VLNPTLSGETAYHVGGEIHQLQEGPEPIFQLEGIEKVLHIEPKLGIASEL
jgi:hypothetical protein